MKRIFTAAMLTCFFCSFLAAGECDALVNKLDLPVKVKTRGKPKIVRWELVDKTMSEINNFEGSLPECELTFGQIFRNDRDDLYFPLTNTLIRLAPEGVFKDLRFYSRDGVEQGTYLQRAVFEKTGGLYARRSYQIYIFQYTTPSGRLMKVGSQLLLDNFGFKWEDIKDKVAFTTKTSDTVVAEEFR